MFEKEAKERAEEIEAKQTLGVYDNDEDLARDEGWNDGYVSGYEEGFQNGAEFGYNKAKEEDKALIEKMKCCHNCRKFHNLSYDCTCAEVCNEWELKEIKEND